MYMCSNDDQIGSQMSSSVRHSERLMEQLLHCTRALYSSFKFKTATAKRSGVVSFEAHMGYNVFQHLIRWKCNFHFQEELKGRVNFNIFSLLNSVIYGTPFYRVTHSFPSLLRDRTTGTSPNSLSLPPTPTL